MIVGRYKMKFHGPSFNLSTNLIDDGKSWHYCCGFWRYRSKHSGVLPSLFIRGGVYFNSVICSELDD